MYAYPCVGGGTLFITVIAVEWMAGNDSSRISSFWHAHDLEARPGTSGLRFCGRHDILAHGIPNTLWCGERSMYQYAIFTHTVLWTKMNQKERETHHSKSRQQPRISPGVWGSGPWPRAEARTQSVEPRRLVSMWCIPAPPHQGLFHGAHKVHGFGMHNLSPDKLPDNIPHFMPLPQCNDPASPNNDSGTGHMTAQYHQVWERSPILPRLVLPGNSRSGETLALFCWVKYISCAAG
ncbi:hypothetical protein DFH08DRAFT_821301 [Mycena albidolilacea]|uniref:Uncharacterized protein n=1 Tax=Mycena albidolilacea TaxID=1033008 RepID=A0AAD7EDS5_9AGAR|nr:hypothetical protein DFH08DRAFT_821301 [Mycena albidolilacea]